MDHCYNILDKKTVHSAVSHLNEVAVCFILRASYVRSLHIHAKILNCSSLERMKKYNFLKNLIR